MPYAKRIDNVQAVIVSLLRAAGFVVHDMHRCGYGVPDLIMCKDGRCEWVEIKSGPNEKLTVYEQQFFSYCPGGPPILAWNAGMAMTEFDRRGEKQ